MKKEKIIRWVQVAVPTGALPPAFKEMIDGIAEASKAGRPRSIVGQLVVGTGNMHELYLFLLTHEQAKQFKALGASFAKSKVFK